MNDSLAGKLCAWEVRYESAAAFFDCADVAFNFANVFTRCGSVDLHHLAGVFDLVKLLIHHDKADAKTGASVKSDYFF